MQSQITVDPGAGTNRTASSERSLSQKPAPANAIRPEIVVLSTSLLTDRMFLHTNFLDVLSAKAKTRVWATSYQNQSFHEMWNSAPATIERFPPVEAFREFPHNYLRRLNELTWDFRQRTPSRLSTMRHVRDKSWGVSIRALKLPAMVLAWLKAEQILEDRLEKLLLAFPRCRQATQDFSKNPPSILFATGPFQFEQPAIVAAAKNLGIPSLALIPSWDNLSTKARLVFKYDGYIVWSDQMRRELHHFYPQTRNVPTYVVGAPQFDVFFKKEYWQSRAEFCASQGLRPDVPIILYAVGSPNFIREDYGAVELARRLHAGELGDVQMLVRPHPIHDNAEMTSLFREFFPKVVLQQTAEAGTSLTARSQNEEQIREWVNTFRHADVVVNFSSTATVDAAILDRPVVNLDFDPEPGGPYQELVKDVNHLWTHFKPVAESGGVWLVNTYDEMVHAIKAYLDDPALHREERQWITKYVCGHVDGRCGERMAEAVLDFTRISCASRSSNLMKAQTTTAKPFRCIVIGGTSLLIHCSDLLMKKGHTILAVISSDEAVKRWAQKKGLRLVDGAGDLPSQLEGQSFEYLFSIVNHRILSDDVVRAATKYSINYHDAPLPRYAGTHATSWALLNHEESHGVSWHLITEQVDAGDIFKQRSVLIEPRETAFTLNTKCYEAAIESFTELIDELATGTAVLTKQNLNDRTFFARRRKPAAAGVLNWNSPGEEISAIVRALDFGPHPNTLATAKILTGRGCFLVKEISVLDQKSGADPGTVVSTSGACATIATQTSDVHVTVTDLDGSLIDETTPGAIQSGERLPIVNPEDSEKIETLAAACSDHERFWVRKLVSGESIELPYANRLFAKAESPQHEQFEWSIPDVILSCISMFEASDRSEFLLTAWSAYLSRLTQKVNFDLAFRDHSEVQEFAALVASHVPLTVRVNPDQSLRQLHTDFKRELENARQHKTFLGDVAARYPELRSRATSGEKSPRISIEIAPDPLLTKTDREFSFAINKDGSRCWLTYDSSVFRREDIVRMTGQFESFLNGFVSDGGTPIAQLPLLTAFERQLVLRDWNATATDSPTDHCIHHYFEETAKKTPGAIAAVCDHETITYAALNARANQLAKRLQRLGVGPEVIVGICSQRTIDLLVGMLAILKAGGAYVPLDPGYPKERLSFIVADVALKVIVTSEQLVGKLPRHNAQTVYFDTTESAANIRSDVNSENLAYVIYTSGSTGRPKGVAIQHSSAAALIEWAKRVYSPEELSGVLASTSVCFDLSIFEIFVTLSCGGKVILVENALHLAASPAANQVSLINTVPSAIAELLRMKAIPVSVQVVNLAGEPLPTSLVQQIHSETNVKKVYDLYGPSEDTTYSTFALRDPMGPATIGRPIDNSQVYLFDRHQQPVPLGMPGELYIGGAGLARGYLNRLELAAEKFVPDAFSARTGSRLYRTGDLARYLPDGNLSFLGRMDHQVKIRGFRIELGEIEAVIKENAAIRDCVVVASGVGAANRTLVAYVVPGQGETPTVVELKQYLKEKLPPFMVPQVIMVLESIPLTPNGKVDRRALPEPDNAGPELPVNFVAPRDAIEHELVKLWEEILKTHPIGVKDDFFQLGGHSLLAVELFLSIESRYGKKIPLAMLFQVPTIEKLANVLREEEKDFVLPSLVPIQPNGSKVPFFCIHARGGNVLFYRDLARRLGNDQPLYGLQLLGIEGKKPRHSRVEQMAAHYISEIKDIQPSGPYYIGGASFGGTAAYEIANQLVAQGEEVALLALFDTTAPGYPKLLPQTTRIRSRLYGLLRRVQYQASSFRLLSPEQRVDYIKHRLSKIRVRTIRLFKMFTRRVASRFPMTLKQKLFSPSTLAPWALLEVEKAITNALNSYNHPVYSGKVTLFRASKQPLGIHPDPTLGWRDLVAGELEIHEVPGYHGAIVAEPHVKFLAVKLQQCLAIAQNGSSASEQSAVAPPEFSTAAAATTVQSMAAQA